MFAMGVGYLLTMCGIAKPLDISSPDFPLSAVPGDYFTSCKLPVLDAVYEILISILQNYGPRSQFWRCGVPLEMKNGRWY